MPTPIFFFIWIDPISDTLIEAINDDIKQAKEKLDQEEFLKFKSDDFFTQRKEQAEAVDKDKEAKN